MAVGLIKANVHHLLAGRLVTNSSSTLAHNTSFTACMAGDLQIGERQDRLAGEYAAGCGAPQYSTDLRIANVPGLVTPQTLTSSGFVLLMSSSTAKRVTRLHVTSTVRALGVRRKIHPRRSKCRASRRDVICSGKYATGNCRGWVTTCERTNSEFKLQHAMSISSFFSSLVAGTLHADAPEESKVSEPEPQGEEVAGEAEAAEEEEVEDVRFDLPRVRFIAEPVCAPRSIPSCVKRRKSHPSARLPPSTFFTAKKKFSPERASSMKIVWKKCEFFCVPLDIGASR